ncbi:serine protease 48-like [Oreochromis niloticus]|uniref:Serine protease 48-like n=1 Tax=Oreochromis niloticus TaxID=8128 RepID=A0A669BAT8_ORENI|nr:serine protease 48-like [Oreochromis niloticus]
MALQQFVRCFIVVIIFLCKACSSRAVNSSIITEGHDAAAGSWPSYAAVVIVGFQFGASLINEQWVLTAASFIPLDTLTRWDPTVYLGGYSLSGSNPNEVSRTLEKIICHPEFDFATLKNDICLLKLSAPVNFTDYIQPTCLASENSTYNNETSSWVIGLGYNNDGTFTKTLQEAKVPIVGNNECKGIFQGSYPKITENMICAGEKDSCLFTYGAPLMTKSRSVWLQSGVLSVSACGAFPSVFTRVSQYQKWISDTVTGTPPGFVTFTSPDGSSPPTTAPNV